MNILVLFGTAYCSIVEYDFKNAIGQVIVDNSNNNYYGVLGGNLLEDTNDPILTDRGAYFDSEDYISLPPNSLLPLEDLGLTNFFGVFYIKLTASGTIFTVSLSSSVKLKIFHENPNILTFSHWAGISGSVETYLDLSKDYLDTWSSVHFKFNFLSIGQCTSLGYSIWVNTASSGLLGSQLSASNIYNVVLGGYLGGDGFAGFISEFYLFSSSECALASTTKNMAVFPSDELNVYISSEGAICDCGSYSCTGVTPTCIECDDSCDIYCDYQSICIDVVEICKNYAIINGICDTSVNYINNCKTQISSTVCSICDSGYSLSGDSTTCCQNGYYFISNQNCGLCDSSCATCFGPDDNSCSSCSDGNAALSGATCECIYGSDGSGNCISCYSECSGCTVSNFCNGCTDSNAEVNDSGRCECKSGYYGSPSSGQTCNLCDSSCSTCSGNGSNACLTCSDPNAVISSGSCTCASGYFLNTNSNLCDACYSDCSECSSSLSYECVSCKDNNAHLLSTPGSCTCNDGYTSITTNPITCVSCHLACSTCSGTLSTQCNSCKDSNAALSSNSCICNSGFYYSSLWVCSSCFMDCSSCISSGEYDCTECNDSNATVLISPGKCECKAGFTALSVNPLVCAPCHSNCEICNGTGIDNCLSCNDGNSSVVAGVCVCNDGYVADLNTPLNCVTCHSSCATCSGIQSNQCNSCKDSNATLSSNSCICNQNFYYNHLWVCSSCYMDCSKCTSSGEYDCIECEDSDATISTVPGKCECKAGFTALNIIPLVCTPCHSDCKTCNGTSNDNCLSCNDENSDLVDGSCSCKKGYIESNLNPLSCTACHQDCTECTGPMSTDCSKCKAENTFLNNSICDCISGYTLVATDPMLCSPCSPTCETCFGIDEFSCLTCNDSNSILINNSCSCIFGYYLDPAFGKCDQCSTGCSKCINDTFCLECAEFYYIEDNSQCSPCHSDCKTCSRGNKDDCLSCSDSSIIPLTQPGVCKCAESEYIYGKNPLICRKCPENCLNCNETVCIQCIQGYSSRGFNCTRNILNLNIEVKKENLITFKFSEDLKDELTSKDFNAYLRQQILKCSITMKNQSVYQIKLENILNTDKQLNITFKFNKEIVSQANSLLIDKEYFCLVEIEDSTAYIPHGLELGVTVLANSVVFAALLSIVINQSQESMMISLNTIQILSYIPLFNIKIPVFLKLFLEGVRPLSVLPNLWYTVNSQLCETPEIVTQFYDYGFTCKNFLFNIGELILLFVIGIFLLILLAGCYILSCKSCKRYILTKLMSYKYSYFLRFWLQSYIDLGIATVISIRFFHFSTFEEKLNSTFGFISAIILFTSPLYISIFYKYHSLAISSKNETFLNQYSPLIENFNQSSPFRLFIPFFFCFRLIFVFVLYYLPYNPYAQISIIIFLQLFNLVFMLHYKIYTVKKLYRLYMLEESIVLCVLILINLFLFDLTEYFEIMLAYLIIGIIGFGILIGILASFIEISSKLKEKCKKKQEIPIEITQKNNLNDIRIRKKDNQESKIHKEFLRVQPFNSPNESFSSIKNYQDLFCENGSNSFNDYNYKFDNRVERLEVPRVFGSNFSYNLTNSRDFPQDE